jgi:osmoprotectant transport system permease protein
MLAEIGGYLSSPSNRAKVFELLGDHVVLALLLLLIGLAMAVPLGWAGRRSGCAGCG